MVLLSVVVDVEVDVLLVNLELSLLYLLLNLDECIGIQLKVDKALGVTFLSMASCFSLSFGSLDEFLMGPVVIEEWVVLSILDTFELLVADREDVLFLFFLVGYDLLFMLR